jgi:hypothetical protein
MKRRAFALLLIVFTFFSFIQGPDLVVKVIKDDLSNSGKCSIGVLKNGSFKSQDDKYKIVSFDFYLLNYRGETKWYKTMENSDIDLSQIEGLEVVKGDLIVIENITIMHRRTGEVAEIKRITERYLVR